mmetsp:Transcript_13694/g.41684  ORF Transcript_13694/g.41684 Transcript_13694/m.41684 type:complete len:136 (+) Transcript_13694:3119-3526(+)
MGPTYPMIALRQLMCFCVVHMRTLARLVYLCHAMAAPLLHDTTTKQDRRGAAANAVCALDFRVSSQDDRVGSLQGFWSMHLAGQESLLALPASFPMQLPLPWRPLLTRCGASSMKLTIDVIEEHMVCGERCDELI